MSGAAAPGRRVLVTGAASGIGRAIALTLGSEGCRVAMVDINEEGLAAVKAEIDSAGGSATRFVADVTDEHAVARAVDDTVGRFGGLDVVVANAGVQLFGRDAPAHELDLETWQHVVDVNLTGAFLTCKHGIRAMLGSGGAVAVVSFLASDAASYVTGAFYVVDGGLTAV